jgi:hypothetical protein
VLIDFAESCLQGLDLCGERAVTFQGRKRRMGGKTFAGFLAESAALANTFDLFVELAVLGIDLCIAGLFRRLRRLALHCFHNAHS